MTRRVAIELASADQNVQRSTSDGQHLPVLPGDVVTDGIAPINDGHNDGVAGACRWQVRRCSRTLPPGSVSSMPPICITGPSETRLLQAEVTGLIVRSRASSCSPDRTVTRHQAMRQDALCQ